MFNCIFILLFHDCSPEYKLQLSSSNLSPESWAAYWSQLAYFKESVSCGLMWYIQVSILHSGHLPGHITLECVKAHHPLTPFIYSEAVWLLNMFYPIKSSSDFVVVDCAVYPQLNIKWVHRLNSVLQKSEWTVHCAVNTSEYSSPSCPSFVFMQLCPQYLEPLHKITKFGISVHQRNKEIVSVPNLLCGSDPTTQQIMIKFH